MNALPYIEVFKSDGFQSVSQDKHVKESDNPGTGERRHNNRHFSEISFGLKQWQVWLFFYFPPKKSFKYLQWKLSLGSYFHILHLSLIGREKSKTRLSIDCETVKERKEARIMSELSKSEEKGVKGQKYVPKLRPPGEFYVGIFTGPVHRARGGTAKYDIIHKWDVSPGHRELKRSWKTALPMEISRTHQTNENFVGSIQIAQPFNKFIQQQWQKRLNHPLQFFNPLHPWLFFLTYFELQSRSGFEKKEKGNAHNGYMWKLKTTGNWSWIRK